jgi:hypothetical protein
MYVGDLYDNSTICKGVRTSEPPFPEGSRRKACRHIPPVHLPAANAATQPSGTLGTLVRQIYVVIVFTRGAITPPEKEPPVQWPFGEKVSVSASETAEVMC